MMAGVRKLRLSEKIIYLFERLHLFKGAFIFSSMLKIGVTGTFCAGKDTIARYLESKNFIHISLSDVIRDEARTRGLAITRDNLQLLGNSLRNQEGAAVLAKRAIDIMDQNTKLYVITSIRNPLEVKELAKTKQFVLISVDAPATLRFERLMKRTERKESDPTTFEDFLASEQREMVSSNSTSQNIRSCMTMARFHLSNEGTFEELYKQLDNLLPLIETAASYQRPSWDEYFMDIVQTVGKRGTCDRGRSGSIIVKSKRIMATGYVGAPPGMVHCDDVGHWFKKTIHEDGSITQHCIRTVHAEANAIAQAARYGISVDGATLYCKMEPCLDCTKLLISAGIRRIVCDKRYHGATESREMLEEAGIILDVLHDEL